MYSVTTQYCVIWHLPIITLCRQIAVRLVTATGMAMPEPVERHFLYLQYYAKLQYRFERFGVA